MQSSIPKSIQLYSEGKDILPFSQALGCSTGLASTLIYSLTRFSLWELQLHQFSFQKNLLRNSVDIFLGVIFYGGKS